MLKQGQLTTLQRPLNVQVKGRVSISHFENLETIKLSEECLLKAKTDQKLSLLHQTVSQIVNAKKSSEGN